MNRSASPIAPVSQSAQLAAELPLISAAIRHPAPLFLAGLAAMWAGVHTGQVPGLTLAYTLFAYLLSLLAVIDIKHGILPQLLTGLLAIFGTLFAPTLGLGYWESTLGGLIAAGGLFLCAFITERRTGTPALGGGDLWLALALGTWLGTSGLPMLLVATAVTGILSILLKRWLNQGYAGQGGANDGKFAFGPALCAAGWLALLYAPAYWTLISHLVAQ